MGRQFIRSVESRTTRGRLVVVFMLGAFLCATLSPVSRAAAAPMMRTWTSSDGKFSTRAELLSRDDKNVKLRNEEGRDVTVPLSRLCKEDLAYLKTLPKVDPKKKGDLKAKTDSKKVTAKKPLGYDAKSAIGKSNAKKVPTAPPTIITKAATYEEFQTLIAKAFAEKDYVLLEATSRALRHDDSTFPLNTLRPKLEMLYLALAKPPLGELGAPTPYSEAVAAWMKADPKSKMIHLAAAQHEILGAWAARGNGVSSTVSEQGARVFQERIDTARALLASASDLPGDDPEFYRLLFIVARAQGWGREAVDKYYTELMQKFPEYHPAHVQLAMLLMPRWGGEAGDMEKQTAVTADTIGGAKGDEIYAHVVGDMIVYHGKKVFQETRFDYERAIRGFESMLLRQPNAVVALQEAAYLASLKNDAPRAGKFFTTLAGLKPFGLMTIWGANEFNATSARAIAALKSGAAGPLMVDAQPRVRLDPAFGTALRTLPPSLNLPPLLPALEPQPEEAAWKPLATPLVVNQVGVRSIRFIPNSRFIAVATSIGPNGVGEVGIWDGASGDHKDADLSRSSYLADTQEIVFDPRGATIDCRGAQGTGIQFWTFRVIPDPANGVPTLKRELQGAGPGSRSFVRYAPSGQFVLQSAANIGANLMVVTDQVDEKKFAACIEAERRPALSAAFSSDSKLTACVFENGQVCVSSVEQLLHPGHKQKPIAVSSQPLTGVCFANDDKLVCCVEASGTIHLFDVASQSVAGKLQAPGDLKQIDIHPGGRLLATAHGESDCVCLWDVVTKKEVKRLTGHTGDVNTVSFATNGKVLASGSQDGTIRLWDVPTTQ